MPRRRNNWGTYLTVSVLGVLLPIVVLSYYAFGNDTKPRSTLLLVSVLFRHGDRTPTDTYPNDPYKDISNWPDGWGELTKKGKKEIYDLGLFLRQRYATFLPHDYSASDIYVTSSDHDRCIMSAQLCLAGLYPPAGRQLWNSELLWQPVPVHTVPRSLDKLIVVKKFCPVLERELNLTYNSEFFRDINKANDELYRYLSNHSGKVISDVLGVESLFNTLEIEEQNKMTLPAWSQLVYPSKMKDLAALSLAAFTHTDHMKRLKGGPILADVVDHMASKVLHTLKPDRSLYLYSGHDLTLVSVMRALGFNQPLKPEPGATLLFELHEPVDGSDHLVQLYYLNNTERLFPEELKIPGCSPKCTLTKFLQVTDLFRPKDWEKECLAA